MKDKIVSLNLELSRAHDRPPNQPLSQGLNGKADNIMQGFKHNLSHPGAYIRFKQKLGDLVFLSRLYIFSWFV